MRQTARSVSSAPAQEASASTPHRQVVADQVVASTPPAGASHSNLFSTHSFSSDFNCFFNLCVCLSVRVYVCMYLCIYVSMYLCVCVCVCTYVCACVCAYECPVSFSISLLAFFFFDDRLAFCSMYPFLCVCTTRCKRQLTSISCR